MKNYFISFISILALSLLMGSCKEDSNSQVITPLGRTGGICTNIAIQHDPLDVAPDKSWKAMNSLYDDNMDGVMYFASHYEAVRHNQQGDVTLENVFWDWGVDGSYEHASQFATNFTYDANGFVIVENVTYPDSSNWARITYTRTATGLILHKMYETDRHTATVAYTYDAQGSMLTSAYRGITSVTDTVYTPKYTGGVHTSSQIISTSNYSLGAHTYMESYSYDASNRLIALSRKDYASAAFVTVLNEEIFTTEYCAAAAGAGVQAQAANDRSIVTSNTIPSTTVNATANVAKGQVKQPTQQQLDEARERHLLHRFINAR